MAAKTEQETADTQPSAPSAKVVMGVLLLIFFLGTSDSQMISPLLPLIAREFGLESGQVGKLIGPSYALAAAVAALIVGPVSDTLGRRRFLLYASILFGLSLLAVGLIKDVRVLALLRLFTGAAAGTFSTCSIAYAADYFPYKRRGVAMSVIQAGYFAALVLGVPIASLLAEWWGWRSSFILFGVLSLLAFALIAILLPEDSIRREDRHLSARVARRFDNIRMIFETRQRVAAIVSAFFVSGGFVGFLFYLGSWLVSSLGLRPFAVGLFFIAVGVASLAGAFVAGHIADKIGKRRISIISTILLAITVLTIPTLEWGMALFAALLVASLAFAFRQGPLQALATELVPSRARGALVAVRNTASQVGIAFSTIASGYLYDRSGYAAVGLLACLLTLGAAVTIYFMREPQQELEPAGGKAQEDERG